MQHNARIKLLFAVSAASLICLLVYLPALSNGFINIDDPVYIIDNRAIRQLDRNYLLAVFTTPYYFGWLPLTYLSFAIDYQFWQLNPRGYHLTNILLHAANAGLVVLLADNLVKVCRGLRTAGRELSAEGGYRYPAMLLLIGLLWGLHPLRVEAVAWVSQRKDVLNGLFSLGAVIFYLRYLQKKVVMGDATGAVSNYLLSLVLFFLSLMAKQSSVVLPVLLLVVDWYPLRRLGKERAAALLLEKLPYFAVSLVVSLLTVAIASKGNAMISTEDFPVYARVFVSGNALFEYWRYMLYPVGIMPFFVIGDTLLTSFIVKTVVVVVATCAVIVTARRWPLPAALWFFFFVALLPVLAFTQATDDTALASRYTYLPSLAPSIAAGVLLAAGWPKARGECGRFRLAFAVLAVALVFGYGAMTLHILAAWKDPGTLWTRQLEIDPLGRAYRFRGLYYFSVGKYPAALDDLAKSIEIAQQAGRDDTFNLIAHHGETLRALGRHEEAIKDFTLAISLSQQPQYYYFRGCSLKALGRLVEAEEDFRRAGDQVGPIKWFPPAYK